MTNYNMNSANVSNGLSSLESQVIEQAKKQIDLKVQEMINAQMSKIQEEVKKTVPIKLSQVRNEIQSKFIVIGQISVQKTFLETYGQNFDVESLTQAFSFYLGNNFHPIITYNKAAFHFNTTLKDDERAFNQNSRQYASFKNTLDEDDFLTLTSEEAYWDDTDPFNEALDELTADNTYDYNVFKQHNKMNQQGGYASLDETFNKAKIQALKEFDYEYKYNIKPQIEKKYGIKLS